MGERPEGERVRAHSETDSFTGGPGVVATKSQARGAVIGAVVGAIVGAVIGLLVGLLFDEPIVTAVVGAVALSVVGGVAGGGQNPKQKLQRGSEADT